MAKIPTYDAIADLSPLDKLYIVDTSDTTDDATGSSKSVTVSDLIEWQPCTAWTYVSASTFTCVGDQTEIFRKGAKLKFTQSASVKYAVVASSAYTSLTTVTIIVSSDYTLEDAAITANYISSIENPAGWPGAFNWTPTLDGFSSDPASGIYRYRVTGNRIECMIRQPNNGTSDATNFTITAPVAALALTGGVWTGYGVGVDNNVTQAYPTRIDIIQNQATFSLYKDFSGAAWTNSGNKRMASGTIFYPF